MTLWEKFNGEVDGWPLHTPPRREPKRHTNPTTDHQSLTKGKYRSVL
jgi:hypothetical protein